MSSHDPCCKCSAEFHTKIEKWDIYYYGLGDGGQYLGTNTKPTHRPYRNQFNQLCSVGEWRYKGGVKTHPDFFANLLWQSDVKAKETILSGPVSSCDCTSTAGPTFGGEVQIGQSVMDLGYTKTDKIVGLDSPWEYFGFYGQKCGNPFYGYEKMRYKVKAHVKIFDATWTTKYKCCKGKADVPWTNIKTEDNTADIKSRYS